MDSDTINPLNPLQHPPKATSFEPYTTIGELRYELHPDVIPNLDELVIEDGKPVESIFAEKQSKLLTRPLYASWKPEGRTFMALGNVGLFYASKQPPLVPDVMLSLDVPADEDLSGRERLSYFVWIIGKPPDVAIEFVSDRRGSEEDYKKDEYERIRVPYYVIFDPQNRLDGGVLRAFALRDNVYQPTDAVWLSGVGLGLTLWDGVYEQRQGRWLRWCDRQGVLIPTGEERAEQEHQRAEQEHQRAERLAAQLRALGIEPNP